MAPEFLGGNIMLNKDKIILITLIPIKVLKKEKFKIFKLLINLKITSIKNPEVSKIK